MWYGYVDYSSASCPFSVECKSSLISPSSACSFLQVFNYLFCSLLALLRNVLDFSSMSHISPCIHFNSFHLFNISVKLTLSKCHSSLHGLQLFLDIFVRVIVSIPYVKAGRNSNRKHFSF